MARIPIPGVQVSARSLRTNVGGPNTVADGDAFGANIGRSMQALGAGVEDAGAAVNLIEQKRKDEDVANRVAMVDPTRAVLEARNEVGPDAKGYQNLALQKFDNLVLEESNKISDNEARKKFQETMNRQRPTISSNAATYEFTLAAEASKAQTNSALSTLQNKVATDPNMYDTFVEQGLGVIDSSTSVPAALKESMKITYRQDAARTRFTGMLERAGTVEDVDAIARELAASQGVEGKDDYVGKDWAKEFMPEDYARMMNTIGATRKAIVTKDDADARAAIDAIEARAADVNAIIPDEIMKSTQIQVKKSQNPVTLARMARVARDQQLIKETRMLPPAELRAQINATNGNPDVAYPGVPPRVSNAINKATQAFGISASYLGATAVREYGQFFKRSKVNADPKFAPQAVHGGVDLRNVRQDVVDAATVAGELFGAPIQVTSGYRSQAKQDGIRARGNPNRVSVAKESHHTDAEALDVNTVGMSPQDKGRLTAAMVDAGFTGVGEYGTHMHFDMRGAVPALFGDREGKTWGGWTYLSDDVTKALTERGFAAGLSSQQVKRAAAVKTSDDVDYSHTTQILDDSGKPTSSAAGVMQFTNGTFIETMRSPGVAQAVGVDISQMSDAQLLKLREDPEISVMAGAALAANNKKSVEGAIGRSISDPEMYMAHFLGAGGGISLIKGYDNQPQQSAAKLLPKAAAANPKVFYDGKRERTVAEVYGSISRDFVAAPSTVAYGDNETRSRIADNKEKNLKDDPMTEAANSGSHSVSGLEDGFGVRGEQSRKVADYYGIPVGDMKPFTQPEVQDIQKTIESGNADKILELMTNIQSMGGDVARAGFKQLDQTNSTFAFAGGLALETGNGVVAGDIVRGEKRIQDNPAIKSQVGEQSDIDSEFNRVTGGSLYQISPRDRQAIRDAALAHYIETSVTRTGAQGLDADAFEKSVNAVLGSRNGQPALQSVNGEPTLLPPGIDAETMETALEVMNVDDWTRMSASKSPPLYADGTIIAPADLADEAKLRSVGHGQYKIQLSDNTFAVTGATAQNGRLEYFIFTPDEKTVRDVVSRPTGTTGDTSRTPVEEPTGLQPFTNSLGQFDENGRWIGPAK